MANRHINNKRTKVFLLKRKLICLAHHALKLIISKDCPMININDQYFLWIDPISGDIMKDGLTVLYLVFNKLCENTFIKVYNKVNIPKEKTYSQKKWVQYDQVAEHNAKKGLSKMRNKKIRARSLTRQMMSLLVHMMPLTKSMPKNWLDPTILELGWDNAHKRVPCYENGQVI